MVIKRTKEKTPAICEGCIRWVKWGENCRYHWDGKQQCMSKCYNEKEIEDLDNLRFGTFIQ